MNINEVIKSGKFYTYAHIRNDTNKVFYVGKGKGNRLLSKTSRNKWWENIVNKHGFHAEILFIHYDEKSSFNAEEFFIKSFREQGNDLVNQTDGGEGASGYKHTDGARDKLRLINTNRHFSNETKNKMSKAKSGNILSVEHKQKISAKNTKELNSNFKGFIIATNKLTGEEIKIVGSKEMELLGLSNKIVYSIINKPNRSHKGYTFIRM